MNKMGRILYKQTLSDYAWESVPIFNNHMPLIIVSIIVV